MTSVALDTSFGSAAVSPSGQFNYRYPLEVPPGIGYGNEPKLSLNYSQSNVPGLLGVGWSIGGISTITRTEPSIVERLQPRAPSTFPYRFSLEGKELLNIEGDYGSDGTKYRTELDNGDIVQAQKDGGFKVTTKLGRTRKYGCTPETRVLCPDAVTVSTWLLEEDRDIMGNYISYSYRQLPTLRRPGDHGIFNPGIKILTAMPLKITWTSHDQPAYSGRFVANFMYVKRDDTLVVTGIGGTNVIGERLDRIQIAYKDGNAEKQIRAYVLMYRQSPQTKFSRITEIRVEGTDAGGAYLEPTIFNYSEPLHSSDEYFRASSFSAVDFPAASHKKMVIAANISGKGLSDVAIIQGSQADDKLVVNTFLAQRDETGRTVSWPSSTSRLARLDIPWLQQDLHYMMGSITGDGRSDLLVAYTIQAPGSTPDKLRLAILKATDTGLNDALTLFTDCDSKWKSSQFLLTDLEGDGRLDLVQIHAVAGKLHFRVFYTAADLYYEQVVDKNNVVETSTNESWGSTISWTPIHIKRTGQTALLRLHWANKDPKHPNIRPILRASTWGPDGPAFNRGSFAMLSTVDLGVYDNEKDKSGVDVFCCDINGDGIQDIVVCQRHRKVEKPKSLTMEFAFKTFLSNGEGGFLSPSEKTITTDIPSFENAKFHVTSMDGSPIPCIFYTFTRSKVQGLDGRLQGLCFCGSTDGTVQDPTIYNLDSAASDISGETWIDLQPADLSGVGRGGWLAIKTITKSPATTGWRVTPIFNMCTHADELLTVKNPLGMQTSINYQNLTSSQVYTASSLQEPAGADFAHILASRARVVSELTVSNQPGGFEYLQKKVFHYTDAHFSLTGRGWLGFANISATDPIQNVTKSEDYIQAWPLTGHLQFSKTLQGATLLESMEVLYETPFVSVKNQNVSIRRIDRYMEIIEDEGKRRMSTTWKYDDLYGNMTEEHIITEATSNDVRSEVHVLSAYTTVNDNPRYLAFKKVTTNPDTRRKLEQFNDGDLKLSKYEYASSGKMECIYEWSTGSNKYHLTKFEYDPYGNITKTTTASNLVTVTDFDSDFHTYPVRTWSQPAPLVPSQDFIFSVVDYTAFDARFGVKVATMNTAQTLVTTELDLFGRRFRTFKSAVDEDSNIGADEARNHLDFTVCAMHPKLATDIRTSLYVVPSEGIQYVRVGSDKIKHAPVRRTWQHFGHSDEVEYSDEIVDCTGKTRLSMVWMSDNKPVVCRYHEFNDQGQITKEMMPRYIDKYETALDLVPAATECNTTEYDAIGRPIIQREAASGVVSKFEYQDQGSTVVTHTGIESSSQDFNETEKIVAKYQYYAGERKVTQITDYSGQMKKVTYDALGRMTSMINGIGLSHEKWEYDSLDNMTAHTAKGYYSVLRQFDDQNHMIKETKTGSKGTTETTQFTYDALGRIRVRLGSDGRTSYYSYPIDEKQSSLLQKSRTEGGPITTNTSLSYDQRARMLSKKTLVEDAAVSTGMKSQFTWEKYKYDWQDRLLTKAFSNNGTLANKYEGTKLQSVEMDDSYGTKCRVHFEEYTAGGKPQKWTVSTSVANWTLMFQRAYDVHDKLLESTVTHSSGGLLQKLSYNYNALQKIDRIHDIIKKEAILYQYSDSRLIGSTIQKDGESDSVTTKFKYNDNGDLDDRGNASFTIDSDDIVASDGHKDLMKVTYDDMGRMHTRQDLRSGATFKVNKYDGFFKMSELENQNTHQVSYFVTDAHGNNLARLDITRRFTLYLGGDWESEYDGNTEAEVTRQRLSVFGIPVALFSCTLKRTDLIGKSLVLFNADHKGSVTQVISAASSASEEVISDVFGLQTLPLGTSPATSMGYESKSVDMDTGLINFGGRWYDPFFGRFTTPDDLDFLPTALLRSGMNRRAFELNDPVNHIDPSGHITKDAWIGIGVTVGMSVVGLMMVLGAGGPGLVAYIGWGLTGGGVAGITYSIHHRDVSGGTFWIGWGWNVGIGATVGIITGRAGAYIEDTEFAANLMQKSYNVISTSAYKALVEEEFYAFAATVTSQAAIGAGKSVTSTFIDNIGEQFLHPEEKTSLSQGLLLGAGIGAVTAGVGSGAKWVWKYRGFRGKFNQSIKVPAKWRAKVVWRDVKNVYRDVRGKSAIPLNQPSLRQMLEDAAWEEYSSSLYNTGSKLFGFSVGNAAEKLPGYNTFGYD